MMNEQSFLSYIFWLEKLKCYLAHLEMHLNSIQGVLHTCYIAFLSSIYTCTTGSNNSHWSVHSHKCRFWARLVGFVKKGLRSIKTEHIGE